MHRLHIGIINEFIIISTNVHRRGAKNAEGSSFMFVAETRPPRLARMADAGATNIIRQSTFGGNKTFLMCESLKLICFCPKGSLFFCFRPCLHPAAL